MEQTRIVKEMREHDRESGRTGDMVRPRFMVWENVPGAFSSNKGRDFAAVLEEIIRIAEPEAPDIEVPEKGWNTWGATTMKWEDDGAWLGECMMRNTGESPNAAVVSRLSQILEATPQGKYSLSAKACQGILRRAERRGKDLPETLKAVLLMQSGSGGGCDGGGKGALVQEDKSGTLGTGNDQTIFCLQGNGIDRADTAGCNGKGWREDTSYTLNTIDRPAVCAGVRCLTPWEAQSARVYDQDGAWHSLNANENGGMARDSVLCAGFKAGQGAQAGGIGYSEEVSPTLTAAPSGTNQTPAVVALDMSHACDVIRDCGEIAPSLQARMGTGGNQVPLTYQDVTGTLSPGAHSGSYNGQDAYNDMLVCGATPEVAHALRAKASCAYREDAETYPVQNMVVRRLTPMECERLQGYPDGWTDIGEWMDSKGKRHKDADSPRYKALGNSIALPFWDFLAKRISSQYLRPVTMGSLFDGIGGFPLVFELHNGKGAARWASEIEEFPIAVTKLRFGED